MSQALSSRDLDTGSRFSALITNWRLAPALVILLAVTVRLFHLGHDSLSHGEAGRANNAWTAWTTHEQPRARAARRNRGSYCR